MSKNESLLKKEFKHSDVQRVRNLVNKDFSANTKQQSGYKKVEQRYKEGDIWEESGKKWTIKNGLKQNITKLDSAKKLIRIPLTCPKCDGTMNYHLSHKMYKIHRMCFDCVIQYEAELKKAGLYTSYERAMIEGSLIGFMKDVENFILENMETEDNFVTEQGDTEVWKHNKVSRNAKLNEDLKQFLQHAKKSLEE